MPSLADINRMDPAEFSALFGAVYEHSPWIAQRAFSQRGGRPFESATDLSLTLYRVVREASDQEQLMLIRSHPELAGKEAQQGSLTSESTNEQLRAGLNALSPQEFAELRQLNAAYQQRFGFPFIICARQNSRAAVFGTLKARLHNDVGQELQITLAQIGEIARLRVMDIIDVDPAAAGNP